jgi:hypothetical protein
METVFENFKVSHQDSIYVPLRTDLDESQIQ